MRSILALLILLQSTASLSAARFELQYPIPNGWKLAYHVSSKVNVIKEYITTSESLEQWTQMLTILEFNALPDYVTPKAFIENIMQQSSTHCQEFSSRFYGIKKQGEFDAAQGIQYCGRYDRTQLGEVTMIKAIKGTKMYVIQMAWRGEPFTKKRSPLPRALLNEWHTAMKRVALVKAEDGTKALHSTIKTQ